MTEAALIAWFTAHPFTRNLCVACISGVTAKAHSDYANLKRFQQGDAAATWAWRPALKQYLAGVLLGGGPVLLAEVLHVLGAS